MPEVSSVCLMILGGPFNFFLDGWLLFLRIFTDCLLLPGCFFSFFNLDISETFTLLPGLVRIYYIQTSEARCYFTKKPGNHSSESCE